MSGLKIGNQDVVHLRFSYPEPKPEGDALWSWYKYASDAGGYFVRGLWFAPCYNNGWIYWWPWDLGVTGGALKDVNNGAHYWGYIQDGRNKNITKGMTKNFAANGWKNEPWDEAITLWGNESNFTDDKGNTLHSVSYSDAKPQAVVADIMRYYEEGIKPMGNVQYEGKRNASLVENYDFEVNSSEIDLSSFKKKHELVPNIWKPNGKLDSRIRLKLLDIADDFWKYVNLTWVKPSGIILTGSICNFNWSQYSDIDLHLIVDFDEIDEKTEFVKDYLDSKKNEWNNEHNGLQIMGYPVELYVQNLGEMPESNGIYDLEENDWVREPNPDDIKSIGLNKFSIKEKAAKIMTIIDDMYDALASTDDSHKIEQMGDDASYLWKKVKEMRKSSLEKNGESGSGNIVYKILRRTGYLDRLFKLSNVVYDKFNSITESTNNVRESIRKYSNAITLLKEEVVADGNSEHNPYKKRWEAERKALKDFICNFGKVMTSKENGKTYKVYYDKTLSQLIGYNYCICLQWDAVNLKPKSVLYIRALDKFTDKMFQANFDARGKDNMAGTYDDLSYQAQ